MTWPDVLSRWSFDPSIVVAVGLAALLYWRGWLPLVMVKGSRRSPARRWHAASFYTGLATVILALESPVDALSASLFSFHMVQHLLLIMVAAPLLLLGDPGITMLRGVPLPLRRRALSYLARQRWVSALGRLFSLLMHPRSVFIIFVGDLYLWHWNRLFNVALESDTVHLCEHLCFLLTAFMFWSQIIDQRAIHARLSYARRAAYTVITAAASNFLAMYFVFAPKPLYSAYASLPSRPFDMTVLGDQQLAGAIMWVPVLFLFGGAFIVCLYKALGEDEPRPRDVPLGSTPYSTVTTALSREP
jgi:putative membrane protein